MEVKIEPSWKNILQNEFDQPYFEQLSTFLKKEYASFPGQVFPEWNEIFRAFNDCPFEQVKVVIIGQDPYPTKGHAHGLCFSVESDVKPLPKSLKNIYKEIAEDIGVDLSDRNGDLRHWATQGVLLLNVTLTVREGSPESHANKGWEKFTDAVIKVLSERNEQLVYMLWGSKAAKKAEHVPESKNCILKAPHPSPLSAYRGFFGSRHFSEANKYLTEMGKTPIKW
jgi:uracil-DNA glycosylase